MALLCMADGVTGENELLAWRTGMRSKASPASQQLLLSQAKQLTPAPQGNDKQGSHPPAKSVSFAWCCLRGVGAVRHNPRPAISYNAHYVIEHEKHAKRVLLHGCPWSRGGCCCKQHNPADGTRKQHILKRKQENEKRYRSPPSQTIQSKAYSDELHIKFCNKTTFYIAKKTFEQLYMLCW